MLDWPISKNTATCFSSANKLTACSKHNTTKMHLEIIGLFSVFSFRFSVLSSQFSVFGFRLAVVPRMGTRPITERPTPRRTTINRSPGIPARPTPHRNPRKTVAWASARESHHPQLTAVPRVIPNTTTKSPLRRKKIHRLQNSAAVPNLCFCPRTIGIRSGELRTGIQIPPEISRCLQGCRSADAVGRCPG